MNLVEIGHIGSQSAQAVFAFAPNRLSLEARANRALRIPDPLALGKHVGHWCASFEGARDNLFRVAETIERSRANPVEAVI
jgi:hypothetical protein